MPTETFMKLPEEKKNKILQAAKKEFTRVPFEQTSIKNIVEGAEIARGSFYQYFTSKEDLLQYMMKDDMDNLDNFIREKLQESKGDIFEAYLAIYDYMTKKAWKDKDLQFYKRLIENAKVVEDESSILRIPKDIKGPFHKEEFIRLIDTSKLQIQNEEDLHIVIQMLYLITRKALVNNFKYQSTEKARKEYLKMIDYLKNGVLK
mgnify:FL=1